MPWQSGDREKIRYYLELPSDAISMRTLQEEMDRITRESPDSIASVQADLLALISLRAEISEGAADRGLIKAGSLEWSPGGVGASLNAEYTKLTKAIKTVFNLFDTSNMGMVLRS